MHETYGVGTETLRATDCKQRRSIPPTECRFQLFHAPGRQARHPRWVSIIAPYALQFTDSTRLTVYHRHQIRAAGNPKLVFSVLREQPVPGPQMALSVNWVRPLPTPAEVPGRRAPGSEDGGRWSQAH